MSARRACRPPWHTRGGCVAVAGPLVLAEAVRRQHTLASSAGRALLRCRDRNTNFEMGLASRPAISGSLTPVTSPFGPVAQLRTRGCVDAGLRPLVPACFSRQESDGARHKIPALTPVLTALPYCTESCMRQSGSFIVFCWLERRCPVRFVRFPSPSLCVPLMEPHGTCDPISPSGLQQQHPVLLPVAFPCADGGVAL